MKIFQNKKFDKKNHPCIALIKGLDILCREDPSLSYHVSEDSNEIVLRGMGAFHLEISISRLETEHRIKNIFQYPMRIDYREVPAEPANVKHYQSHQFQNKNYEIYFEYEISPNGQADFTKVSRVTMYKSKNMTKSNVKKK